TTVYSLGAHQTVKDVIALIRDTKHDGFPVLSRGKVVGLIAARDIVESSATDMIAPLMRPVSLKATTDDSMTAVARKMFRFCVEKIPVVDAGGMFVGIITNADILRSQIERVTPEKVFQYIETLKSLYGIEPHLSRGEVNVRELLPTQDKVYMDELESRKYEIKQGLAEPLVVVHRKDKLILIDGHHRAVAANRIGAYKLYAYIIDIDVDEELGIEKTARSMRLWTVDNIQILNESRHSIIG
ncbi:MAG TPA: CBS domain-containing protein, partial [Methanocorpusculum sp.]|nr:CBS domain-containing protein [Methanocorpusculum sp.]